jgi:antitoxin MazE
MKIPIAKWGNTLVVRIPKHIAEEAKLRAGDFLEIKALGEGYVELRRASGVPTLTRLISKITLENRYAEISTTAELGKEVVEW